jgi:hypothetical protein
MNDNKTPKHFQIDDDIDSFVFCWTKQWENKPGKPRRRSAKTSCDFLDGLKTVQLAMMCDKRYETIGSCQLAWDIACSFRHLSGETMDEPEVANNQCSHAFIYVNADLLKKAKINYDDTCDNWEDFDFHLRLNQAKIPAVGLRWLTFYTAAMNPNATVASAADGPDHRWTIKSMEFYRVWGELGRCREQNGQINIKVRTASLPKWPREYGEDDRIGKYQIIQNPEIMKFISNNDVLGFEKYILELEQTKSIGKYLAKHKITESDEEDSEKEQTYSWENATVIPKKKKVGFSF